MKKKYKNIYNEINRCRKIEDVLSVVRAIALLNVMFNCLLLKNIGGLNNTKDLLFCLYLVPIAFIATILEVKYLKKREVLLSKLKRKKRFDKFVESLYE